MESESYIRARPEVPGQTQGRVCRDHPLPSSDLFVHTLQHVRGTEPGSVLLRQTHHSHGILKALFQAGDGLGSDLGKAPLRPPVFFWLRPYREPRGSASPHGPLHSCTSKTYALRRCASDGPGISARGPLEVLLDGPGQPSVIIRDTLYCSPLVNPQKTGASLLPPIPFQTLLVIDTQE